MKATIENGGIPVKVGTISVGTESKHIHIFNMYLNMINACATVEDLRVESFKLEFSIRASKLKLENPFYSGFVHNGFGVYYHKTNERKIFVECETDIEL